MGPIDSVYFSAIRHDLPGSPSWMTVCARRSAYVIGREGMLGTSLPVGVRPRPSSSPWCRCRAPRCACRRTTFAPKLPATNPFGPILHRYVEAHHAQVMQTAACNGRHDIEQRLARCLLMAADRADGPDLPLTQEFIGHDVGCSSPQYHRHCRNPATRRLDQIRKRYGDSPRSFGPSRPHPASATGL